jgi:predicted RNase H-like HicB family nuclease
MPKLVDEYSYNIAYSPEDRVFIGRVAEWPYVAAHGASGEAALREVRSAVQACLEHMEAIGGVLPEPLSRQVTSDKLHLRLPSDLHCFLAREAERKGTSLNELIVTHLDGLRSVTARNKELSVLPPKLVPAPVRASKKAKPKSAKAGRRSAGDKTRKARKR